MGSNPTSPNAARNGCPTVPASSSASGNGTEIQRVRNAELDEQHHSRGEEVVKTGWLELAGTGAGVYVGGAWRRKYFILGRLALRYFERAPAAEAGGRQLLKRTSSIADTRVADAQAEGSFAFGGGAMGIRWWKRGFPSGACFLDRPFKQRGGSWRNCGCEFFPASSPPPRVARGGLSPAGTAEFSRRRPLGVAHTSRCRPLAPTTTLPPASRGVSPTCLLISR